MRINKMRKINELVESLQADAKQKLHKKLSNDKKAYKKLITRLLVQGLIRLIEADVTLRCRKSDVKLIEECIPEAIADYKKLMLSQVKALSGREDIPSKVKVDTTHFLPEYNAED